MDEAERRAERLLASDEDFALIEVAQRHARESVNRGIDEIPTSELLMFSIARSLSSIAYSLDGVDKAES